MDDAGSILIRPPQGGWQQEYEDALTVINNWRSSHSFPLNTFQVGLRQRAKHVESTSLIAQRIKRLSSIELKLRRFKTMQLSQMQDIGGCRAVLKSVGEVNRLVGLYKDSDLKHKLVDVDDYIQQPRQSGYRSVHLKYRYYSDRKTTYNGLRIEMQLRSQLQHAWATAVETVGTFIQQALKSSQGEKEWLRFFALMGTAIAIRENTPPVPDTPTSEKQLVQELRKYAVKLDVEARLRGYGAALQTLEEPSAQDSHYYLLVLDASAHTTTITGYRAIDLDKASSDYLRVERAIAERPGAEAVLVSVESMASLRRAYPNFFLDTSVFIDTVKRAIRG